MRRLSSLYTKRWYIYVASCTPWKRYALVSCLLGLVCIGWFFAIYCPLKRACCLYEQQLKTAQDQCHTCSSVSKQCSNVEYAINNLKKELKPYQQMDSCPLLLCMDRAEKSGLLVHTCTMGQGTSNDQQHKELVTIEISGAANSYIRFLSLLAQLPHIIAYEQIHIEYAHAQQLQATTVLGFVTFN